MFDDFMHNNFPEMHIHQAHQDAMLHAQNQAMQQAIRTQNDSLHEPAKLLQAPSLATVVNCTMNLGLIVQIMIERIFKKHGK